MYLLFLKYFSWSSRSSVFITTVLYVFGRKPLNWRLIVQIFSILVMLLYSLKSIFKLSNVWLGNCAWIEMYVCIVKTRMCAFCISISCMIFAKSIHMWVDICCVCVWIKYKLCMCLCDRALDVKAYVGWSAFSQPGRCVSGVAFVRRKCYQRHKPKRCMAASC